MPFRMKLTIFCSKENKSRAKSLNFLIIFEKTITKIRLFFS